MELGEFIREKRKSYSLSQVEMALRADVGLRFVKDLEAGKKTVQMDKVNDVLGLFGMELRPVEIGIDNEKS